MLNWDPNKQQARGKGIFGTVLAFAPAHEEQGRRTLHSHWQIWTEDLSTQVREDLWSSDRSIRKKSREAFYRYVDEVMTATYSKPLAFNHNCIERMQEKVTGVPQCGGLQFTDVGSSVDDLTYDSKMVRNVNQDITNEDGRYTIGRADCSVGVPVIHPDYDMGGGDMDDLLPTHQSCRAYNTTPIVDLTDEFSKEVEFTENNITHNDESIHPIFEEKDLQLFRDARHESLCYNDNGKLMICRTCRKAFSPIDLVDATLRLKMEQYGLDCIPTNSSVRISCFCINFLFQTILITSSIRFCIQASTIQIFEYSIE